MLRHRGPDDEGYLVADMLSGAGVAVSRDQLNDDGPVRKAQAAVTYNLGFGFRRLAILDLSLAGHQPMADESSRKWIVYNGEVYNYRELRVELEAVGYRFRSETDTEVVLASYNHWGAGCLDRFNGMWAIAILDLDRRRLFLARDRFGVKPLFYTHGAGRFSFASEIKALVGGDGAGFEPEVRAVAGFLTQGELPNPNDGRTFFRDIWQLPPGCWMEVGSEGNVAQHRYYSIGGRALPGGETARGDDADRFAELFRDAVRLRLRSDVPVGSCLSGGLDSSAIVCEATALRAAGGNGSETFKTFSAVYRTPGRYNEIEAVRCVVDGLGANSNLVYPTGEKLCEDVERLVWHQDEPFQSTSIFAQWCVMEAARKCGVPVLLDGQGADEALAGYRPFGPYIADYLRAGRMGDAWEACRSIERICGISAPGLLCGTLARVIAWPLTRQVGRRRRKRNPETRLVWQTVAKMVEVPEYPRYPSLSENLQTLVTRDSLPHLLRYEDRNSMAFSIEARVPFVDYRLMQFCFSRPNEFRIRDGWTKWMLRKAFAGRLPESIAWRRDKVGFETPQDEWLKVLLRRNPDLFGGGARIGEYVDVAALRGAIDGWMAGNLHGVSGNAIWRFVNTEFWLRTFSNHGAKRSGTA